MSAGKIGLAGVCAAAVLAITAWTSFCAGVYFSARGHMLNQAHLELSHARLEVTLLDAIQAGDFERSNDILRQGSEFDLFLHDDSLRVAGELSIWTYVLHPLDTFGAVFYVLKDVKPLSDAEISNLRARIGGLKDNK